MIISGVNWLFLSLTIFIVSFKLNRDYGKLENKNVVLKYFIIMFISLGIFLLLMSLPHLVLLKSGLAHFFPVFMAWAYIEGHIFLYFSLAYALAIPVRLFFPKLEAGVFYFFISAGIIVTLLNILFIEPIIYSRAAGITLINNSFIVSAMVPALISAAYLPAAFIFLFKRIYSKDKLENKSWLLILFFGFIIVSVGGPIHDYADTALKSIIADSLTLLGYLIIAKGAVNYTEALRVKSGS